MTKQPGQLIQPNPVLTLFSDSFQCECLPWNLCKWSYDIAVKVNKLPLEAEKERKELTEYFRRFICGDPNDQRVHCCGDQVKI